MPLCANLSTSVIQTLSKFLKFVNESNEIESNEIDKVNGCKKEVGIKSGSSTCKHPYTDYIVLKTS